MKKFNKYPADVYPDHYRSEGMKNIKKLIPSILILFLLVTPISSKAEPDENYPHTIAGYGAISGDLISPNSSQIFGDSLYVLDNFGITVYDITTQQIKNKFPVDLGQSDKNWEEPNTWVSLITNFRDGFMGLMKDLLPGKRIGDFPGYTPSDEIKPDISVDSKGNLFSLTKQGIRQINREDGSILKTIPLSQVDTSQKGTAYALKIYEDQFYLLKAVYDLEAFQIQKSISLYVLSLGGFLLQEISIRLPSKDFRILSTDFMVMPTQKVFAFVNVNYLQERLSTSVQFFGWNGQAIDTESGASYDIIPTAIETIDQNKLLLSGFRYAQSNYVTPLTLSISFHQEELGSYYLENAIILQSDLFGLKAIDLTYTNGKIAVVTTGKLDSIMDHRVILIQEDSPAVRFGTSPYRDGQIFGSFACAVDEKQNLYETSFRSSVINVYDKQGINTSKIEMDLGEMSSLCGCLSVSPMILDMTVDEEYLYCTNLFPNSINRYSFRTKKWKQLFWEDMSVQKIHLWLNIKSQDGDLYLLDSASLNEGAPNLAYLDNKNNLVSIDLKGSPTIDPKNPPLFIGFTMTDQEYQFLDCIYHEIWTYRRTGDQFIQKIKVPIEDGFSTSFDNLMDGSWVVADVIHNTLLRISKTGELLEKIGKTGVIKEGFNRPVRVKTMENRIYVSDLMNCRYHIILTEPDPEILWKNIDLNFKEFDWFTDLSFELEYDVLGSRSFNYRVSSKNSWIRLSSAQGSTREKKIAFTILGSFLKPWENNQGLIAISFPSRPEFNKQILLEVFAKGNKVVVRIDGSYATVNENQVILDAGMSPLVRNDRTFVGLRFMNDLVFKKLSTIAYDPKTQTVLMILKDKKLELVIGKTHALVNGINVELDVAPFISNGRTFVPLRFVAENLDASLDYDSQVREITILYPKKE
jgi:hypothetical protein